MSQFAGMRSGVSHRLPLSQPRYAVVLLRNDFVRQAVGSLVSLVGMHNPHSSLSHACAMCRCCMQGTSAPMGGCQTPTARSFAGPPHTRLPHREGMYMHTPAHWHQHTHGCLFGGRWGQLGGKVAVLILYYRVESVTTQQAQNWIDAPGLWGLWVARSCMLVV